jgi:WhiB family redox-sensing transcriptional regulator
VSGQSWRAEAACADPAVDPESFHPVPIASSDKADGRHDPRYDPALAVCARCPVREQCRDWALETGQTDGVWGGLTPDELRRKLRRTGRRRRRSWGVVAAAS